jgi:hypothetical protein
MKKIAIACIATLLVLNACKQKQDSQTQQSASTPGIPTAAADTAIVTTFDFNKIPVSDKEIGSFPYLSAPEGYEYKNEKSRNYEEKYFFYSDSLLTKISGKYFFATIYKEETNKNMYEKTFVVRSYTEAIENLGAVQIHNGTIHDKSHDLINKEAPAYFKDDLNNDFSRKNKQFLLKTAQGNIWFELSIHDRDDEVFLTVIQEEGFKQTIAVPKG